MDGGVVGRCCGSGGEGAGDDTAVDLFGAGEGFDWGGGGCGSGEGRGKGRVGRVNGGVGVAKGGFEGEGIGF